MNREMRQQPEVVSQVQALLAEVFDLPSTEIPPDLAFGDLPQWDSLGHMDVMARLEEVFGIAIDSSLIAELTSLPAIAAYVEKERNGQN